MPRNAAQVIARFWVICFVFALFPFGLPAVLAGAISLSFLALVAFLVALGFNFFQWAGHRLLFGGTPEYEELRASGRDAWFVSCPWPFRSESEQLPVTDDEPEIRWYCKQCGAEAFDLDDPCRVCGFEYECPACGSPVDGEAFASQDLGPVFEW